MNDQAKGWPIESTPPSSTTAITLTPGEQIGNYRIEAMIASGGSSAVYRAKDTLLDRDVAIKQLIGEDGTSEAMVQRARSEGLLHKQAAHDQPKHLVQLIDIVDEQRGLMLVTELVEGRSLEQDLAADPAPRDTRWALAVITGTAKALTAIHGRKIIHRDLKPANILLGDDGTTLKVSDFGLAAIVGDDERMTEGTSRYVAPETWRGEPATPKTDLYALGMIAYEMLAGREKFDQAFKTILRDERHRDMRWMKWHTNPRTKAPGLRTLNPDVPEPVETLVHSLLEKEPGDRPASAAELTHQIKLILRGKSDDAAAPGGGGAQAAAAGGAGATTSPGDTAPLPARRSRLVPILSLSLAVLLGVAAFLVVSKIRADREAMEQRRGEAVALSRAALDELREGQWTEALTLYQRLGSEYEDVTDAAERSEAGSLWARAELAMQGEDYSRAFDLFTEARDTGRWSGLDLNRLDDRIDLARAQSNFAAALAEINAAIDANQYSQARVMIARWRGFDLSDEQIERLNRLSVRLHGQQSEAALARDLQRADQQAERGELDQAIATLSESLDQVQRQGGAGITVTRMRDRLRELTAQRDYEATLAAARQAQADGETAEAIERYREVREMRDTPEVADRLARLETSQLLEEGRAALEAGNTQDAERLLTAALGKNPDNDAARQALKNIESTGQKVAFVRAGDDAMASGDYELAIRQFQNALQFGPDDQVSEKIEQARVRLNHQQGLAALDDGQFERARERLERARQLDPDDARVNQALADLTTKAAYVRHIEQGDQALAHADFRQALREYREAMDIRDTSQVRQRMVDAEYAQMLAQARAYVDAEQYRSAQALLRTALQLKDSQEVRDLLEEIEAEGFGP